MQKNISKKIIISVLATLFIFGMFVPFNNSSAQTQFLSLNATPSILKEGETSIITAQIHTTTGGETIYFSTDNGTFTTNSCVIPLTTTNKSTTISCSVTFTAKTAGTPKISATVYPKGRNIIDEKGTTGTYSIPPISLLKVCTPSQITITGTCTDPVPLSDNGNTPTTSATTDTTYTPLAPLPGLPEGEAFDTQYDKDTNPCPFGKYLNIMIKLIIGFAAVMAMVMIVMGGIEYMTSELVSSKEAGKETIQHAILGLLIALGAYMILNTINPQLLSVCLDKLPKAEITIYPDSGDDIIDPDFAKGIYKYSTDAAVSDGVTSAIAKIKDGWRISKFTVHTNNKMTIELIKGSTSDYTSVIDIAPGYNGYAPVGTGKKEDHKTPLGDWKIIGIKYKEGEAQFNQKGSNMGAAFWHLDPMTSGERGIGIHGNKRGTLGSTNGCIRLKNADILALEPYIRTGFLVSVKQ